MNKEYKIFVTYVRTLQFLGLRLRGAKEELEPVYISQKEIEQRFFVYPLHSRKEALAELVRIGEIAIHEIKLKNKKRHFTYEALKRGELDFSLIIQKQDNFSDPIIKRIRDQLKYVSLLPGAPSTLYFDKFIELKDKYVNLFFTVDDFARRVHTPITNFHREFRSNIIFHRNKVASLDVATMQPLLLGKILLENIGENEYSNWINEGKDIYLMLKDKAALNNRNDAKKRFFEILFSPPSDSLSKMFGASNWIEWINSYKMLKLDKNPHNKSKRYSNLAWLLQSTEVKIMYKVWRELDKREIPFLTIHDEILIQEHHSEAARNMFEKVLRKEFVYFKLNSKISQEPPPFNIKKMEDFYNAHTIPKEPIRISNCETIINFELFYKSHLAIIKADNNHRIKEPYFNRLNYIYNSLITHSHE